MSTIKRIAIIAGAAGVVAASAGSALAAGPDHAPQAVVPTSGPATSGDFVLPPDYVQLTDDTGTITVAVPNTWTDTSTLPFANDAGVTVPRITAATDYQVFHDTFDAPGVEYVALPYDPDQQGVMDSFGLTSGCATTEVIPYNDGAFVGLQGIWSACGPTNLAEWHQLVVSPADNSHTLLLQVQITSPAEEPVLQNILASFNTGSGATPTTGPLPTGPLPTGPLPTPPLPTSPLPTSPLPTSPLPTIPVPTAPFPTGPLPTTPLPTSPLPTSPLPTLQLPTVPLPTSPLPTVPGTNPAIPAGFVQLVDDTGLLTVAVPDTWTDVDTAPVVNDVGTTIPRITAASDYDVFHDTFDVPGVEYVALPFDADQQGIMTDFGLTGGCGKTDVEPYDDGAFVGLHGIWSQCGPGTAEWHQIVVSPPNNSHTLVLQIQTTGPADAQALQTILDTFNIGSGTAPTPTVLTPTVPTLPNVPVPPTTNPLSPNPLPTIPTPATAPGG